jgi:hypothetical protein
VIFSSPFFSEVHGIAVAAAIATREEIAPGIHRVEDGLGKTRAQLNIFLRGQKIMEALRSFLKARSPNAAISHRLNLMFLWPSHQARFCFFTKSTSTKGAIPLLRHSASPNSSRSG